MVWSIIFMRDYLSVQMLMEIFVRNAQGFGYIVV